MLNTIMGRKTEIVSSFIEVEGSFLTKPSDIANYFGSYLVLIYIYIYFNPILLEILIKKIWRNVHQIS